MFNGLLVGNQVKVLESSDPTLESKTGFVVDETRNIIKVRLENRRVISIPKTTSEFRIELGSNRYLVILGKELLGTAQERIYKS
jgi:RNase P/RNase MRP subunit p29